jgi:hypothetical protein
MRSAAREQRVALGADSRQHGQRAKRPALRPVGFDSSDGAALPRLFLFPSPSGEGAGVGLCHWGGVLCLGARPAAGPPSPLGLLQEGSKKVRGGAAPSDESEKGGLRAAFFCSPAALARVGGQRCALVTRRAARSEDL